MALNTEMEPPGDRDLLKGTWWFPLRRYLPGWGLPICWQGWTVLVGYLVLLIGPCPFLLGWPKGHLVYVGYAVVLTLVLGVVMAKKGEPIR